MQILAAIAVPEPIERRTVPSPSMWRFRVGFDPDGLRRDRIQPLRRRRNHLEFFNMNLAWSIQMPVEVETNSKHSQRRWLFVVSLGSVRYSINTSVQQRYQLVWPADEMQSWPTVNLGQNSNVSCCWITWMTHKEIMYLCTGGPNVNA